MEPSHPGLEREANVRLATRLKTAVVLVRRIVRRPCRSELRLFLAPPESFCLSNPFAAIAPVKIRARREAASPSYPRAGPRSGPQSDRLLEHLPTLRDHLMGQSGSFGQAWRAARCGAPESRMAGKRRPKALWAADEPLRPTEGRVVLSRGRVALLIRCPASHFEALLTTGQNNPGQMTPQGRKML